MLFFRSAAFTKLTMSVLSATLLVGQLLTRHNEQVLAEIKQPRRYFAIVSSCSVLLICCLTMTVNILYVRN